MAKKVKKTKAELEEERIAAEEEARKQKILDDKRRAEETERNRLEALRIAAERKVFREAEVQRLTAENAELTDMLADRRSQMRAEVNAERERIEWEKFKDPSTVVDASNAKDLNTFLTLTGESKVTDMSEAMEITGQ
jgi:colicin import membrane protein